ncbi:MAG: hypothetical protein FJ123_10490 [Deltaproteobacteria bacterium]|nr:hypothetical protein [Deltaproteobacteria bacterium]
MRKAHVLSVVLLLFWMSSSVFSHQHMDHFKPGMDPDGFGGIQWEAELSTLQDMKLARVDPSYGGIGIYLRVGNVGRIGKVEPRNVEYLFWKGKFTGISIIAEGAPDCESLREAVFDAFGKGKKPYPEQDYFVWDGKIILMSLEFFQDGKGALFRMIYKPILYRMEWEGK